MLLHAQSTGLDQGTQDISIMLSFPCAFKRTPRPGVTIIKTTKAKFTIYMNYFILFILVGKQL